MITRLPVRVEIDPAYPAAASPMVDVVINGEQRVALLDTGAATSSVRDRPGLRVREVPARGTGAFGVARETERRAHVDVWLGPMHVGAVDAEVIATDQLGHDALIGQDILSRWCWEFALGEGVLVVDRAPLETGLPIHMGAGRHIYVDVEWDGGVRGRALFDTGASLSVVHSRFVREHPELFTQTGETLGGIDADGHVAESLAVTMGAVTMLGSQFGASQAVHFDLDAIQRPGEEFDLIVGWPVLRQGRFVIDPLNQLGRHIHETGRSAG